MVLIPCPLEEDPEAVLMLQICLKKNSYIKVGAYFSFVGISFDSTGL